MLAKAARSVARIARPAISLGWKSTSVSIRCMSDTPSKDDLDRHAKYQVKDEGRLPTPRELLVGKAREEEIFEDTYGISLYDRRAMQFMEEGTLDNPICILSEEDERIVGISLQDDANIRWFVLRDGEMAFDPYTNNYLAIRRVSQEQIDTLLAIADKQPDPFKVE